MDLEKFYNEKYPKHWGENLQVADRVFATLRHKTDGSRNVFNADVIVVENIPNERKIIGWWDDRNYDIPYNELKEKNIMFPSKIYFPSDSTTAILKEVKNKVGIYEYQDGYFFKGTTVSFSEGEIEKLIKKRIIKDEKINTGTSV